MFTYPDLVPDQILSTMVLVHEQVRFGPDLNLDQSFGTVYITKFGPDRGPIRI